MLGRDLYPSLAEERSRWEKELAGLREENESLTAMLCSKEEELNRTKATMNAIREERDRLRRRVSAPRPACPGPLPHHVRLKEAPAHRAKGSPKKCVAFVVWGIAIHFWL